MELVKHETCQEYFHRRLSEGWKYISLERYNAVLLSPGGIRRELDLRNDIETLRPNGAGTLTQCSIGGTTPAPTNWQSVDEAIADEDVTYVYNTDSATTKKDLYALPASGVGAGTINSMTVYARLYLNLGSTKILVYTHATEYSYAKAVGGAWVTYSQVLANNPNTTNPWTWAEINALEVGVHLQCPFSISGKTEISMADGTKKKAKELEVGDRVISFNIDKKTAGISEIRQIASHLSSCIVINKVLKASPEQLIFVNDEFVPVGQLRLKDTLLNQEGERVKVSSLTLIPRRIKVYGFTLDEPHTFFADNFLVHNPVYCTHCTQEYIEVDYTPAAPELENKSANMGSKMVGVGLI